MRAAAVRVGSVAAFGVLPVVVAIWMLVVAHPGSLAVDFHHELYPEAQLVLDGENPFPPEGADLSGGRNFIWPTLVAVLVSPLTALPPGAADWTIAFLGLACMLASLRIVGVRDWRVYGAFALWPQMIGELRVSHLTPLLCLLLAIAWRYRDTRFAPGLAVGLGGAVKFFLWPVGVWLAAIGRAREALVAAAVAGASLLLILPFTSLSAYVRTLADLGRAFDHLSYSPFGLLVQAGAPDWLARTATLLLGAALLVVCWRRASLALAVAAALVLSPIVWIDYFALAAVPLAIARPRLSPIWLVPLVTWGLTSDAETVSGAVRVLGAFAVVLGAAALWEPDGRATRRATRRSARAGTASRDAPDPRPAA